MGTLLAALLNSLLTTGALGSRLGVAAAEGAGLAPGEVVDVGAVVAGDVAALVCGAAKS